LDVFSVPPRREWRKAADMDFQDLLVRYFGQADIDLVAPESLEAGLERIRVDFGLERDSGHRFGLWTLMYMLGNAPDLDVAFKDAADREAARDFMDMVDRLG
jgi:hypothetical protein